MASSEPKKIESTLEESSIECHELVGHGRSGYVYRATWTCKKYGQIEVAAKKIPILPNDDINEKFGSEINYLQALEHKNIVTYYGHAVTEDNLAIVTEYAPNGSLSDHLKRTKRLPPALKVKWAIQAAKSVRYLQVKKILHRDVKSGNFLISSQNDLKICDFGFPKDLTSTASNEADVGTVRWLAPEVFTEFILSPKADIFAFGVILWELETCEDAEEPYKGMLQQQVMWMVGSRGLRPDIPKNCPYVLKELMQRCWHKDRRKRPDADEIIRILEDYQSSLKWHHKHTIKTEVVASCNWINHQQLAVCMVGRVQVYDVTTESSQLAYTLTNEEWVGKGVYDVALSESLPDRILCMLVICKAQPYVYQYRCHEAKEMVNKYKIKGDRVNPLCIVANSIIAVVRLSCETRTLVICSLPDFTSQYHVHINFDPYDISISQEYLLVTGTEEMVLKPLSNVSQNLCRIKTPHNVMEFRSVSFRNNAREVYFVSKQNGDRYCVYKYTWDGEGNPDYTNAGCVIDELGSVWSKCLSVTADGLLAVGEWKKGKVKVFSLE